MGQILIAPIARSGFIDPLNQHLEANGLKVLSERTIGDWRIVIHGQDDRSNTGFVDLEDGDFAAHIGAFFYNGLTGDAALRQFHAEFSPNAPPWADCMGHFALVLVKQGQLYLVTDRLGSFHLYHDDQHEVFSSSFIGVLEGIERPTPDVTGIYEYAWNGATFGTKTIFKDVHLLPAPCVVSFGAQASINTHEAFIPANDAPPARTMGDAAAAQIENLQSIFKTYTQLTPRPFRSALSGGFDSRLILAALLDADLDPDLFTFGTEDDPDVTCAKALAEGEGLRLQHTDKARYPTAPLAAFSAQVERDIYVFDGLKNDGLFESGIDFEDRINRHADDGVVMNGSVGEIYRNFFYLPDGPMPLRKLVWSFFSQFDPAAMSDAFSTKAYENALIAEMQKALGTEEQTVSRAAIEALYPLFRGRFWSARDTSINQRFGWMLYPFLEPAAINGTITLPLKWKQYGRLEAEMIRQLSPRLAHYESAYGYPFDRPVPLKYRAVAQFTLQRPAAVRRLSYRLKRNKHGPLPVFLSQDYLAHILDTDAPFMRRLFRLNRLTHPAVFNRVMTVEYLCQRYNARDTVVVV